MINEALSFDGQPELFQVEGQLAEEDILFLEEASGLSTVRDTTGNISTPFRAKSKFAIGQAGSSKKSHGRNRCDIRRVRQQTSERRAADKQAHC